MHEMFLFFVVVVLRGAVLVCLLQVDAANNFVTCLLLTLCKTLICAFMFF